MSFARISTDDMDGVIRAYTGDGIFTDDKLETFGSRAVVQVPELQKLMKHICRNGFEHHAAFTNVHAAEGHQRSLQQLHGLGDLLPSRIDKTMENTPVKIFLNDGSITACKQKVAENGSLSASTFRYASGVAALEICNAKGHFISLPFHGQQIWDAAFNGRRLTMHSPVHEPLPTREFLANMGAFLFHCGMSAMGSPGPEDTHPLHGELVNAAYLSAYPGRGRGRVRPLHRRGRRIQPRHGFRYPLHRAAICAAVRG